jgi:hypothetical protein
MRSPQNECLIAKYGLEYDYVEALPLEQIDVQKSLRNQARLNLPTDEEAIAQYAQAMREGMCFPPLILWRPGKGKWVVVDGNQRLHAMLRLKLKSSDAYLLKSADPRVIDRVTWSWNNRANGRRISPEEALEHAVSFVRQYKVPAAEAALEWGVKERVLEDRIRLDNARDTLRSHGVKVTATLTEQHLRVMNPLLKVGEDVFCNAVQAVCSVGATSDEAADFTREVTRASTVEAKLQKIADYVQSDKAQERRAETKNGTVKVKSNGPREAYVRWLRQGHRLQCDYPPKARQPHSSDWKEMRKLALEVAQALVREFGLGDVPQGDRTGAV